MTIKKIAFLSKYGSENHQAKNDLKINHIVNKGKADDLDDIVHSPQVKLSSDHIHKIIDKKSKEGFHPAMGLLKYHFGSIKDDHWRKLAMHKDHNLALRSYCTGMPTHHIEHAANNHPDTGTRSAAKNSLEHRHKTDAEDDELLRKLGSATK
jgi:hypothetical protein